MSVDISNQRPRSRTVLSFNSNKSGGSAPKFTKEELVETPREKASQRMSSKANPNIALAEVEPGAQALTAPTMDSNLRGMQHRDMYGNIITDPDRSNPTRSRLERPLDTIRSFEAAVDGKYGSVGSYNDTPGPSRPASTYLGTNTPLPRARSSFGMHGGSHQYGGANRAGRPESYIDSSMYGSANRRSPAPFGGQQRRSFGPRNSSDPALYGNHGAHGHQQPRREPYQPSYDSIGSSGGSGGTDNWQPSTDPSSPNSSVDRFQPQPLALPKQQDPGEQYGFAGFGGVPQTDLEYNQQQRQQQQQQQDRVYQNGYQQNGYQSQNSDNPYRREDGPPPPPPAHTPQHSRRATDQSGTLQKTASYSQQPQQQQRPEVGDKRKSWLMRRFSKKN